VKAALFFALGFLGIEALKAALQMPVMWWYGFLAGFLLVFLPSFFIGMIEHGRNSYM
jgi:hypothetical protein